MLPKPIEVKALKQFELWLKYADGTEGIIDLAYLAKKQLFAKWQDQSFFEKVYIDNGSFGITWDEEIDLCPVTLYLKLKGLTFEEWNTKNLEHAAN